MIVLNALVFCVALFGAAAWFDRVTSTNKSLIASAIASGLITPAPAIEPRKGRSTGRPAGRPKKQPGEHRVAINTRVSPDTRRWLDDHGATLGGISRAIDFAVQCAKSLTSGEPGSKPSEDAQETTAHTCTADQGRGNA
jgi:hypothetical protein